ncbi:hypothetical protein Vafri_497 [Volvox africanus]|nr:hypothetical protein Vafri_497 [Volvox africanus]
MELPQRTISVLPLEEQRALFVEDVHSAFNTLRSRGMEPNEACALALKVAAGVAELPPTPDDLARRLRDEAATPLSQLCSHVTRFFASSDCLNAAFWPKEMMTTLPPTASRAKRQATTSAAAATASVSSTSIRISDTSTSCNRTANTAIEESCGVTGTGAGTGSGTGIYACSPSGSGSDAAATVTSSNSSGPSGICPLDFTAVAALYDSVLGCRVSSMASVDGGAAGSNAGGAVGGGGAGSGGLSTLTGGSSAALGSALAAGVEGLLSALSNLPHAVNPGLARQLGVLLANPLLDKGEHHDLLGSLVTFIAALSQQQRKALVELFITYPADELRRLLSRLHSYISLTLFRMQSITRGVEDATRIVALLHEANEVAGQRAAAAAEATGALLGQVSASGGVDIGYSSMGFGAMQAFGGGAACGSNGRGPAGAGWRPLEPAAFYNDAINHEDFNLKEDFRKWKHPHKYEFCFCKFPFMYDPGSKARILQMENQMSQVNELNSALLRGLFGGVSPSPIPGLLPDLCPFLVLRVRRGPYLVQDTLIQIHRAKETDSLKKPLKVKFIGEEGVDEGGVAKEFFQLLVRQLFNPDYGMFSADPTSHLHWFRPSRLEMDLEFELVGILIGLAIYNSHILEFQFPSVLYKKLMGATVVVGGGSSTADGAAAAAAATSAAVAAAINLGSGGHSDQGVAGATSPTAAAGDAGLGIPGLTAGGGGNGGGNGSGNGGGNGSILGSSWAGMAPHHLGEGGGGVLGLEDLRELAPEVASSLAKLLQMSPDLVESLALVFQVDVEMGFGEVEQVDLVPGGSELPVTAANRRLYVDLYVKHLLQARTRTRTRKTKKCLDILPLSAIALSTFGGPYPSLFPMALSDGLREIIYCPAHFYYLSLPLTPTALTQYYVSFIRLPQRPNSLFPSLRYKTHNTPPNAGFHRTPVQPLPARLPALVLRCGVGLVLGFRAGASCLRKQAVAAGGA